MNINWNRKYLTIAVYATCAVIVSAIAIMVIFNFDTVMTKLSAFGAIVNPIIIGIFCAYLLNPLMMKIETGLFKKLSSSPEKKLRARARGLSLTLTMLAVVAVLSLVAFVLAYRHAEAFNAVLDRISDKFAGAARRAARKTRDRVRHRTGHDEK